MYSQGAGLDPIGGEARLTVGATNLRVPVAVAATVWVEEAGARWDAEGVLGRLEEWMAAVVRERTRS